ncbi:hypothetical protein [Burkholderia multivorans]|uniref:hypothetical protein n=1 Tax=Burkholderia multivorans TaxID=87883 RepID=UPI0021C0741F|nr:hypothetical protein [Burkholderia multivorans]
MLFGQEVFVAAEANATIGRIHFDAGDVPAPPVRAAEMCPAQPRRHGDDDSVGGRRARQAFIRASLERQRLRCAVVALGDQQDRHRIGKARAQCANRFERSDARRLALHDRHVEGMRVAGGQQVRHKLEANRPVERLSEQIVDALSVVAVSGSPEAVVERAPTGMVDRQNGDAYRRDAGGSRYVWCLHDPRQACCRRADTSRRTTTRAASVSDRVEPMRWADGGTAKKIPRERRDE